MRSCRYAFFQATALAVLVPVFAADFEIETEMVSLNLLGQAPFKLSDSGPTIQSQWQLRESPTLPSKGKSTLHQLPGGEWAVDSFFDIFAEVSIDGLGFQPLPPIHFTLPPSTLPSFDPLAPPALFESSFSSGNIPVVLDIPHTFIGMSDPNMIKIEMVALSLTPIGPSTINPDDSVDNSFNATLLIEGNINPPFSISLVDIDPIPLHSSPPTPVPTPEGMPAVFAPSFLLFLLGASHWAGLRRNAA